MNLVDTNTDMLRRKGLASQSTAEPTTKELLQHVHRMVKAAEQRVTYQVEEKITKLNDRMKKQHRLIVESDLEIHRLKKIIAALGRT